MAIASVAESSHWIVDERKMLWDSLEFLRCERSGIFGEPTTQKEAWAGV